MEQPTIVLPNKSILSHSLSHRSPSPRPKLTSPKWRQDGDDSYGRQRVHQLEENNFGEAAESRRGLDQQFRRFPCHMGDENMTKIEQFSNTEQPTIVLHT